LQIKLVNATQDCPTVWWQQAHNVVCTMYAPNQSAYGRALSSETEAPGLSGDQLLAFRVNPDSVQRP